VKRAADDPEAVSSVQIRISFTPAGKAAAAWVWTAQQRRCAHLLRFPRMQLALIYYLPTAARLHPAEQPQPLVQAEAPSDDPAGFTLTTTELERLGEHSHTYYFDSLIYAGRKHHANTCAHSCYISCTVLVTAAGNAGLNIVHASAPTRHKSCLPGHAGSSSALHDCLCCLCCDNRICSVQ
jgi:hypothetical protein